MRVWYEVTKDLLAFAIGRDPDLMLSGKKVPLILDSPAPSAQQTALPPAKVITAESALDYLPTYEPNYNDIISSSIQSTLIEPKRMYINATTHCFVRPVRALDTVVKTFTYGEVVLVTGYSGRWAAVTKDGVTGWVLKDAVATEENTVFPSFENGVIYEASHPETVKLRLAIRDEFAATDLLLPLESIEYVWYRLVRTGRTPQWPLARPRVAGRWQQLLRGCKGVHIGITPVTKAVMEYSNKSGDGILMFVESVKPDESVTISGIDFRVPGRFITETIPKSTWQEWAPVFIQSK